MDFSALHQGVMMVASMVASITFATAPAAPQDEVSLSHPEIVSFNLQTQTVEQPDTLQSLTELTQPVTDELKMVVKEVKADEITTVDQPPIVYTVSNPTPKPSPETEIPEDSDDSEDKKPEASENPSPSPSTTPAPILTGSNADILFQMTNDYRAKMGKPAFEKEERLCKIAEARAPQVSSELAAGTLHKGFRELNLPYWATENIAAYATMKENFQFLSTDYIHRKAIESDHKYSCTACVGTSCSQIFSTFVPK